MGYDFDTSGHYVGWSPYFNFNSIESLKASEMLPTPNGKLYAYGSGGVDITNYLNQLNKENFYNPESVSVIAEMLNAIDDARILTYSGEVDTDNVDKILTVKTKIADEDIIDTIEGVGFKAELIQ